MLASSATVDVSEPVCAGPEDISSGISFLGAKILDHAEDAINNPASSEQSTVRRLVRSSYAYQPQRDSLAHLSVSASSRGVPLNDLRHVLDPRYMFSNVFSNLRDIGSSFFYLCMLQTFGTFFSVLLTLIAYLSFRYGSPTITGINQGASWSAAGFLIFLPALGLAAWTFARREQALRAVATVKSLTLWIYLAHRDWVLPGRLPHGHLEAVQQTLFNILGEMRSYLSPPRYYSTTFPYIGVTKMMLSIAQDRAKNVRRIASNFKKLSQYNEPLLRAGLDYAGLSKLNQYYMQLHLAFEELTNLKEYRTPLPLRALTRFYLTLVIPIFFGPYYATATISSGFNASLAIIIHFAMLALMNASITMEDPFDGRGVDNIYIDEPLSECEHVILMDEDAELETAVQEFLAKPGGEDERDDMEQGFGSTGQRGAVDAHEGNEPKQPCTLDAAQTEEHSLLQDDHSSLAHSDSLEDAASGLVVGAIPMESTVVKMDEE